MAGPITITAVVLEQQFYVLSHDTGAPAATFTAAFVPRKTVGGVFMHLSDEEQALLSAELGKLNPPVKLAGSMTKAYAAQADGSDPSFAQVSGDLTAWLQSGFAAMEALVGYVLTPPSLTPPAP